MGYDRLLTRLDEAADADDGGAPLVALPDGSVDVFYRLHDGRDRRVETRAALAERIVRGGVSSFRTDERDRQPGGQAVNLARQAAALGDEVTLYGHLDHPVFDDLPVETHSMGDPAWVQAFAFDDGDLMLSEWSAALGEWDVETLRAVSGAMDAVTSAAVVCVVNWLSVPGVEGALREFATLPVEDVTFVLDPGDVTGMDDEGLRSLHDALGALASTATVVTSTNVPEMLRMADAADVPGGSIPDRLTALREGVDLDAAVVHGQERALAAIPDDLVTVPTLPVDRAVRHTGAGDRFDGGLAHALAVGWDWSTALAAGNACAAHFVATADTADPSALRSSLRDATLPE